MAVHKNKHNNKKQYEHPKTSTNLSVPFMDLCHCRMDQCHGQSSPNLPRPTVSGMAVSSLAIKFDRLDCDVLSFSTYLADAHSMKGSHIMSSVCGVDVSAFNNNILTGWYRNRALWNRALWNRSQEMAKLQCSLSFASHYLAMNNGDPWVLSHITRDSLIGKYSFMYSWLRDCLC